MTKDEAAMFERLKKLNDAARSNQEATPDARTVEEIISAWAFAHDIDGAARNDLFARLRAQEAAEWQREYLLLASYCGDDNAACTETRPCADCLAMCNVFDEQHAFLRELGSALTTEGDGRG